MTITLNVEISNKEQSEAVYSRSRNRAYREKDIRDVHKRHRYREDLRQTICRDGSLSKRVRL